MVVDFARGRIRASVEGGMNVVPVEDVGRAHVLALERGRPGERYLVGGENLSFEEIFRLLARATGRPPPRRRLPHRLALGLGWADELRCRLRPGAQPLVPLEGVHMSRKRMYVSCRKAASELGYSPSSVPAALERALAWYRAHGHC
jgi:dihydroflavonol-4-reductase